MESSNGKEKVMAEEEKQKVSQKTRKVSKILLSILILLICLIVIFICYELATANKKYYIGEKDILIPIFLYHNIVEEQHNPDYMETKKEVIEKQVSDFLNLGYDFISYEDLIAYQQGKIPLKKRSLLVAFDDGYTENETVALPIIEKYQIPVAIFVIDDTVGKEGYLSWDQIRHLEETGLVSIHTHGKTHYEFDKEGTAKAVADVEEAHAHIEKELGKSITKIFTYPYGLYRQETIDALTEAGFVQNLTDNKINKSKELNLSQLHRMYPLEDPTIKILAKIWYRSIRY